MSFELINESLKYGALGHSALDFGSLDFGAKLPEELHTKDDKRLHTNGLDTDQPAESALPTNQQLDRKRPRPGHPASCKMGAQLPGHARGSQAFEGTSTVLRDLDFRIRTSQPSVRGAAGGG